MQPDQLNTVTQRVRAVAEAIQPQLLPHPGLAQRNAYAHVWLGLKVVFGEDWRERAAPASVHAFLDWMERCPNEDYAAYTGPVQFLDAEERGLLFE